MLGTIMDGDAHPGGRPVFPDLLPVRQKLWSKRVADLDA
jgi:hypothetical protein